MNGEPVDDRLRLIERGFPLRETSLASVHEKNVRHGHISTLHIWPARRPLAACRAALIATLLPDPGDPKKRAEIYRRLAGTLRPGGTSAKDIDGGILRWGTESGPDLEWFREEIREAYGGRAPRVLDPFAGGGAIPLEAMRLGCETTAVDINPVAWFVLKCTLEYPQRFAGKRWSLPSFANEGGQQTELTTTVARDGDLADHVRAWGRWVLERARADLSPYYPTIDGKPTVAYLWARTVRCKGCRATIPLFKTRWLSKAPRKAAVKTSRRVVMLDVLCKADSDDITFAVRELSGKERAGSNTRGTMTRSGAKCPCCPAQMSMEDLRLEGRAGRMGATIMAVVVQGSRGKDYRLPTNTEREQVAAAQNALEKVFAGIPYGVPTEPLPSADALGFRVQLYGQDRWDKLFTSRQLLSLGNFVNAIRAARDQIMSLGYDEELNGAIVDYLCCGFDRMLDFNSTNVSWIPTVDAIGHTFVRYALPMVWDFSESALINYVRGGWQMSLEAVLESYATAAGATRGASQPRILCASAIKTNLLQSDYDVIVTDPPYYDAIPYASLMDYFYVWLRRMRFSESGQRTTSPFASPLSPKWDLTARDGELIDDASRFGGDKTKSRKAYEEGMQSAFAAMRERLSSSGVLVVVFANKDPNAWESLVTSVVEAGFLVDASWPLATEQAARMRAQGSAALSSSVWLVCRSRGPEARDGWDVTVREAMRDKIRQRLREYWDAGTRGPDFVWSAIGPALEVYSKHPRIKKVDDPGAVMTVSDFLAEVRREVVAFAAARVLATSDADQEASNLDGPTTYYLLHRHDFGFDAVPAGASILYAVSCGLRDTALVVDYDLLERRGRQSSPDVDEDSDTDEDSGEVETNRDAASTSSDGSSVKLKPWDARSRPALGEDALGRPAPLIDQIHRLMRLWKLGDASKVNAYITQHGLGSSRIAREVIQALIELAPVRSEERTILEGISNHLGDVRTPTAQTSLLGA